MITITIPRNSVFSAVEQSVHFTADMLTDVDARYSLQVGEDKAELVHGIINAAVAELLVLLRPWTMMGASANQTYTFDTTEDISIELDTITSRKAGIEPMLTTLMHTYLHNRAVALYLSQRAQVDASQAFQSQAAVAENAIYNTLNFKNKPIV